jgi:hypothetical protein
MILPVMGYLLVVTLLASGLITNKMFQWKHTAWIHNRKDMLTFLMLITVLGAVGQVSMDMTLSSYNGGFFDLKWMNAAIAPNENKSYWMSNLFHLTPIDIDLKSRLGNVTIKIIDMNRPNHPMFSLNTGEWDGSVRLPYHFTSLGVIAYWRLFVMNQNENTTIRVRGYFGIDRGIDDGYTGALAIYSWQQAPTVIVIAIWVATLFSKWNFVRRKSPAMNVSGESNIENETGIPLE